MCPEIKALKMETRPANIFLTIFPLYTILQPERWKNKKSSHPHSIRGHFYIEDILTSIIENSNQRCEEELIFQLLFVIFFKLNLNG